jgi:hypothetical protein
MLYFAPLLAGFDSQLKINCLGQYYKAKGLLAVKVRPIQSSFRSFLPSKKARALEKGCIVAKKGAKGPIFEGMYRFFLPS